MSMTGLRENWPLEVRLHYFHHLKAGTLVVASWPRGTPDERTYRMNRHFHFYQRLLCHIAKMHPDVFTDPWLKKIIGAPGSGEG